ncbi:hypothetical protein AQJ67_31745 [Streptomyces caeruleatus]|uniref:Uncharacterized protein n=1 Tax=Streptomyces caeruleatus TaxID=661399 RepID=A0A124I7N2_9ACTN|nr:hypothetical protein AQJ67_31745 [Streptomyces caeruleatus]
MMPSGYTSMFTSRVVLYTASATTSALLRPTVSIVAPNCRLMLETSKVSGSATFRFCTPMRTNRSAVAPPMPPTPAMPMTAFLSLSWRSVCSSTVLPSQPRLRRTRRQ